VTGGRARYGARVLRGAAVVVLALAGLALALWFFTAQDDATTHAPDAAVPGTVAADPSQWADELRTGNLVIAATDATIAADARTLARDVAGTPSDSAALRAAGQSIRVARVLGPLDATVVAYAHDRAIAVDAVGDPQLRAILQYWLGRAG
jgi:hypothetical protein